MCMVELTRRLAIKLGLEGSFLIKIDIMSIEGRSNIGILIINIRNDLQKLF